MVPAALVAFALEAVAPATPEQEARIQSTLSVAVQKVAPATKCDFPRPEATDLLDVIAAYEGRTVPTVTVAGQDQDTSLADIVVGQGRNPIYLVLTSYDPSSGASLGT